MTTEENKTTSSEEIAALHARLHLAEQNVSRAQHLISALIAQREDANNKLADANATIAMIQDQMSNLAREGSDEKRS